MRGLSVRCLVWGHDDRIRRATGGMYLECAECGRATRGWNLPSGVAAPDLRRKQPQSSGQYWHEFRSQVRRDPFGAVGLR
jgi:hypothetical protein